MNLLEQPLYQNTTIYWSYLFALLSIAIGLLLHTKILWNIRIALAGLASTLIGVSLGLSLVSDINLIILFLLAVIMIYRVFSLFRIIQNRVNSQALLNRSLRSELTFSISLLTVMILDQSEILSSFSTTAWLNAFGGLQLVIALVFLQHALSMRKSTQVNIPKKFTADIDLPSVTVAIPARNETDELNGCIRSILQTNYPKLEVLVVDDCSQDNTSEIIKKFAHQGVRFISGKTPPSSWLAKNYAYHQLLDEAGGKYIIFCGTDVRFEQDSLRILMQTVIDKKSAMTSVLPLRKNNLVKQFLLQPMRYWRELAIPRIFDRTPPVLSTCWVARRSFLEDIGGFAAHKKTIRPERIISRIADNSASYKFVRATTGLGISSIKNLKAQWSTATRTRYPELKNRPENIMFYSLMYSALMLTPPIIAIYAIWYSVLPLLFLALSIAAILLYAHALVDKMVTGSVSLVRLVIFPISLVLEIIVSNYSMWAYEYSEVIWKGRNVCLPILQTNLALPKLDETSNINVVRNKNRKS